MSESSPQAFNPSNYSERVAAKHQRQHRLAQALTGTLLEPADELHDLANEVAAAIGPSPAGVTNRD